MSLHKRKKNYKKGAQQNDSIQNKQMVQHFWEHLEA